MAVALPLCLAQKKSPVNGRWEAKLGSQTYRFDFTEDQGDVTGSIRLPDDQTIELLASAQRTGVGVGGVAQQRVVLR